MEQVIRDKAKQRNTELHVWTGVHGILSLNKVNSDNKEEIFPGLYNGTKVLPVPEKMWKVCSFLYKYA